MKWPSWQFIPVSSVDIHIGGWGRASGSDGRMWTGEGRKSSFCGRHKWSAPCLLTGPEWQNWESCTQTTDLCIRSEQGLKINRPTRLYSWRSWRAHPAPAYNGSLRAEPSVGSRGKGQGVREPSPPWSWRHFVIAFLSRKVPILYKHESVKKSTFWTASME